MHGARRSGLADAARDQHLDVARLNLDVDSNPVANDIERLREGWNARPVCKRELFQLRCRQLGDRVSPRLLWMPGVNNGIVVHDDNPVACGVHVQLYSIGSELDGTLERGERVLGMRLVGSPVSDPLGRVVASTCGQAFLRVVALCLMSAKL